MSFPQLLQTQAWNGENLPKSFNLYLALDLASKSFLNTCLVLYLVTIIVVKCKHPLPLFRSSVRKFLKQVWYFARLFVLWLSPKVLPLGNPQTSLVFRSLIRTLAIAEGTSARKILKQVWYFARLFVPLHIHTRKRRFITNNKILLNT